MPSGAAAIRYSGKRGVTWSIKYVDASGDQVWETLGKASEGWSKRKAEKELRARLVAVEQDGYAKPKPVTFASFGRDWLETHAVTKPLKRSTKRGYEIILETHLIAAIGRSKLGEIDVERVEAYMATKRREGLDSGTVNRHLNVLSLILKAALRRKLVTLNVVSLVERPREKRKRWRILRPQEVGLIERSFDALIAEATNDRDRDDMVVARRLFLAHMGAGIRRGEAAGARWRSVALADPDGPVLRVEETFVRHATDTPKSEAGNRTIALGSRLAAELWDHRQWSAFDGDDDLVFPNPRTGRPFDANRYAELFRKALVRSGITEYVRPSHDLRHSSITNAAAAGTPPEALMSRAGHSSYATTRRYIDLARSSRRCEWRIWL